jgi:type IV pilus modification protein PilV
MTAAHHSEPERANETRAPRRSAAGFSLLEVMIAMVLLAFGVLAMGSAQLHSLRFAADADNRSQATYLAEEWLSALMAAASDDDRLSPGAEKPDPGGTIVLSESTAAGFSGGNADGVGRTTAYERFWRVESNTPVSGLRQITVRVTWRGSAGLQSSVQLMGVR